MLAARGRFSDREEELTAGYLRHKTRYMLTASE